MGRGLLVAAVGALALALGGSSLAATCPAASAYSKKIAAQRAAYFKTHKKPAQRTAFVKKQQAKLASLRAQCGSTPPAPAPTPAPPPTPPSTLTIGADVPAANADFIKQGYSIATGYFPKIGAPSTWRADVVVAATVDEIDPIYQTAQGRSAGEAKRHMPDGGGAFADHDHVYIVPAGSSWDSSSAVRHIEVAVHEMFHTVQYAIVPTLTDAPSDALVPPGGPRWLIEGAADFVAYSALEEAGLDAASFRNEMVGMAKGQYSSTPLQNTATTTGFSQSGYAPYAEGFVAVELLTKQAGPKALIDYWTKVGQGTAWESAFQQVFGRTIDQFYAEFPAYRDSA